MILKISNLYHQQAFFLTAISSANTRRGQHSTHAETRALTSQGSVCSHKQFFSFFFSFLLLEVIAASILNSCSQCARA